MNGGCFIASLALVTVVTLPSLPATPQQESRTELGSQSPPWCLEELLKRVPTLKHDAGGRWPMAIWGNLPHQGKLSPEEACKELARRGLAEIIPRFDPACIETAKAIQKAGGRVIVGEGWGESPGPYGLAGDESQWAHRLPVNFKPQRRVMACPLVSFEGWARHADELRTKLKQFKSAGVTIDAAWLDYEGDPYYWEDAFQQARLCPRCRNMFPRGVLDNWDFFQAFIAQLATEMVGAYWAGPIREVFPNCSVTNFEFSISTPQHPYYGWTRNPGGHQYPLLFTAVGPAVYASVDSLMESLNLKYERIKDGQVDPARAERAYTHVLMRGVSANAANMSMLGVHKDTIPWVSRWIGSDHEPDTPKIPIPSRARYREVLRHLWLRGVTAMQIFNPENAVRPDCVEIQFSQIEDPVAVYDEMLAYRDFLDRGEVMNTAIPGVNGDGPVWSGLRLSDRAVVRAFTQGVTKKRIRIEAWPGLSIKIEATPNGQTYLLTREKGKVGIRRV